MAKKSGSSARIWFLAHSWLALPIWAFLFFVCLTGTIATVSQEIMWLVDPAVRSNAPSSDAVPLGYDEALAAIERQMPGSAPESITRSVKSQFALMVDVTKPDGATVTLYVNPYTGAVQGEQGTFDFRQFVRALHGWLLTPFNTGYAIGWYAVSMLSIPLLGSLITGVVVYKKFWRAYLNPRVRVSKGSRIFWGDLHRLVAVWSIPFIAIISVTAGWFLVQATLSDNAISISSVGAPPIVAREHAPTLKSGEAVPKVSVDRAVAAAKEKFPDLEPGFIQLPYNAFSHVTVWGRGAYPLIFEQAAVNPYTYGVEWTRRVSDRSGLELVTESMRPLHVGDFVGLWLKLVYFLFGVLLTTMSLSGMLIWTKRTAQATAAAVRKRPFPEPFPEPAE
ncbi:PepSY-associated TM helix domain-containing protein [Methylopila sp. M107]|uniref:PepSY-associated TM helix domain-containing protein n=1 Tax=Methylopila sp. M107 TaxID=1101190 RepID=UPI000380B0A0|nr:PepSY-associated TM helix domain-containing protein [Methylopila sp. M107]